MRSILLIFILCLLASCGKDKSETTDQAIDIALTYLTDKDCQKAIRVLEDAGRDESNAIYLQVLASAYACRANYDEIKFLDSDITTIDTNPNNLLKSLTKFTLSPEHVADSAAYTDLKEALSILLYIGDAQPSQAAREAKFGPRKSGDMGIQTLFLALTELGKFLHFYGNVNAAGVKGGGAVNVDEQGAVASSCFAKYTNSSAVSVIGLGAGGACTSSSIGHPNLSFAAADLTVTKRRMCEGLMLVTNLIDVLENVALPTDPSFGDLSAVAASVTGIKTAVVSADPALETLLNTTSQATCETLVAGATEFGNLQYIYALLFETRLP